MDSGTFFSKCEEENSRVLWQEEQAGRVLNANENEITALRVLLLPSASFDDRICQFPPNRRERE
jgi:hypothetical protein